MGTTTVAAPADEPKLPKRGGFGRVVRRILLTLFALIVLLAIGGAIYNAVANSRDAARFPQQGKSYPLGAEFGGTTLNLDCSGPAATPGSPTVILDSGLGVPAVGWKFVQPEVAKFARVCSYDRAGYGWSSAGQMPRTSLQIVKELHALLGVAGEKPPYVIVGHSFGGYNIRVYNGQYPAEIAGMVLVDASHEDQVSRMPPELQEFQRKEVESQKWQLRMAPLMIHLGIARLMANDQGAEMLPKDFRDEIKYLQLQGKFLDATASEFGSFEESAKEVRAAGTLGDKPLIVLSAGKDVDPKVLPAGFPVKAITEFHDIWLKDLQVKEAHLSTRGKQIIVPDSTHMIPFERPERVTAAIQEVWEAAKGGAAAAPAAH